MKEAKIEGEGKEKRWGTAAYLDGTVERRELKKNLFATFLQGNEEGYKEN